jgi:hypothetical protein
MSETRKAARRNAKNLIKGFAFCPIAARVDDGTTLQTAGQSEVKKANLEHIKLRWLSRSIRSREATWEYN